MKEEPEPGIEIFCVDCGVTGHIDAVGQLSAGVTKGVTKAAVRIDGRMHAGIFVGVNAFAEYTKEFNKTLLSFGAPGFSIPNVATIGPRFSLGLALELTAKAQGHLITGAALDWPAFSARLDMCNPKSSYQSGFVPK